MDQARTRLMEAEQNAALLFRTAEDRGLIAAGKTERQLNEEIFALAKELFGIEKYWHKRIIRSGPNTLQPYNENPPDLMIQEDDILFFDFGPIFEDWEADFGRTYVIGDDPVKQKLKKDIELAWHEGKEWFHRQTRLTGAEFYQYAVDMAGRYGWTYGGEIAGHLIGQFPTNAWRKGTTVCTSTPKITTICLRRTRKEGPAIGYWRYILWTGRKRSEDFSSSC